MFRTLIAASALLLSGAASAQVTETPPANPANMPLAESATPPPAVEEAQIKQDLAKSGYTEVQDLKKDGDGWKGTALHNGKRVPVKIAADGRLVPHPM